MMKCQASGEPEVSTVLVPSMKRLSYFSDGFWNVAENKLCVNYGCFIQESSPHLSFLKQDCDPPGVKS